MANGYIYDPYGSNYLVPVGGVSEALVGPMVPQEVVEQVRAQNLPTMGFGAMAPQATGLTWDPGTSWINDVAGGKVQEPDVLQAGIGWGAIIPFLMGLGAKAIPIITKFWPQIAAFMGGATLSTVISQLGGGNGGNGTGLTTIPGTDISLGGPFAPEPPAAMIAKEWGGIGGSRFYLLTNGRIAVRKANGTWKLIRRVKMLHMKSTNPRLGDVVKADRIIQRAVKVVRRRLPSARRK